MTAPTCTLPKPRAIAEFSVERDHDYGEGGPTYQVHVAITSAGCAAQLSGPPENCHPAEGPEWEITGIEAERWNAERKAYDWVPIEQVCDCKEEIDAIEHWAEMLDLDDEVEQALHDARDAAEDWRAEN